jgi:hypothetical protein
MASIVIHEYYDRVPKSIPAGKVLVHNDVYPVARRNGSRGSRFWLQPMAANLLRCDCGWHPDHWYTRLKDGRDGVDAQ